MSETETEDGPDPNAPPEPGGWLAEYQRAHCVGASALDTFQGVLSDEIFLPQSAADNADPAQLVLAANGWCDALLNQAYFIPGEFAQEALWSFYVHDYFSQAKAAGHAQYYANRGGDEIALRCCGAGLKSMLADPQLDIFNLMARLNGADARTAQRIATQAGYRSPRAALQDLDRRFAELEEQEPLTPRHKIWLKSLRKLKLVPDAEMNQHLNRIAAGNPLRVRRKQEADFARAEAERNDPGYQAVRQLCEMAGLRFGGLRKSGFTPMRALWPEGPDLNAYLIRVDTDRGPRSALFYMEGVLGKRRLAVLIEQDGGLPLGSLSLNRDQYDAIVPAAGKK